VHGLEGDIRHGGNVNSYYDDPHSRHRAAVRLSCWPTRPSTSNAVDKERLKDMVGRRRPLSVRPAAHRQRQLPVDPALLLGAERRRAAPASSMANSASDARASEQELRQKLDRGALGGCDGRRRAQHVLHGHAALHAVVPGPRARPNERTTRTHVLFIDARHIYRQVDRAHRDWTPAQIGFMANLVRLYRGEATGSDTQGGAEAEAKLKEMFGAQLGVCRRARPVQGGDAGRDRGAGLVAEPGALCGRGAGGGGQRRGLPHAVAGA
jgi:type I restriction enzyme M protein